MAAGQHNPSRRALLGTAVALSFSSFSFGTGPRRARSLLGMSGGEARAAPGPLHPAASRRGPPPRPREDRAWREALDLYLAAEADVEEAEAWPGDDEDEYGERLDSLCDALRRLLRTPAPDLRALAIKIDLAMEHELGTLAGAAACLAAIREDARRLAAAYPGL